VSKKSFIDSVKVGSPCGEEWERMEGSDRVRFCSHCAKHVNNLSEMSRKEAMRFVRASGGDICIRYIVDPRTKRPIFAEQLLQIRRRAPIVASGALTASLAMSTSLYAQDADRSIPAPAVAKVFKDRAIGSEVPSTGAGQITGTVMDQVGAVIPGATVRVMSVAAGLDRSVTTNDEGVYAIDGLPDGNYRLEMHAAGFQVAEKEVTVGRQTQTIADEQLGISIEVKVDVIADVSLDVQSTGGVIVSVEYTSRLSRAVADEDKIVVRELLARGEKVNVKEDSYSKITPMFLAVETGDLEIVQMLLDAGAKVNVRSTSKETPLMRLDQDATPELVSLLMRYGAKVNSADENGSTPLIHAAEYSTPEATQALIQAGADVNAANNRGETALMKAAERGDADTVKALIYAGANINAKDGEGNSAWKYADERAVEDVLLSFGIELTEAERQNLAAERAPREPRAPETDAAPEPTPPPMP